jgi:hypothetical protein
MSGWLALERDVNCRREDVRHLPGGIRSANGQSMRAKAVVRVFCVDGPMRGLQFLDVDTGRVLSDRLDGLWHIYLVSDDEMRHTDFGPSRVARFDRAEPAGEPAQQSGRADAE